MQPQAFSSALSTTTAAAAAPADSPGAAGVSAISPLQAVKSDPAKGAIRRQPLLSHRRILRYDSPEVMVGAIRETSLMQLDKWNAVERSATQGGIGVSDKEAGTEADAAALLDESAFDAELRAARIARIQAAIADGTYISPARLEAAVDRMLAKILD